MQYKKLVAGIAAVAAALGGMALGAMTANADELTMPENATPSTITLNKAADANTSQSTYTAYRIAAYTDPVVNADGKLTSFGLQPVDSSQWDWKISEAITAANIDTTGYKSNLYALASLSTSGDEAKLRDFVDNLSVPTKLGSDEPSVTATELQIGDNTVPDQGWYFVTDSNGTNLLVGTALTASSGQSYTTLVNTNVDPATEQTLGVVNVKPNPAASAVTVTKSAYMGTYFKKNGSVATANVGDTLTYVVSSVIPTTTGQTDPTFTFKDTASKGLTVDASSIRVFYDADDDDKYNYFDATGDTLLAKDTDYTVTGPTASDSGTVTQVDVKNVGGKDGQKLTLLYKASTTKDAVDNQVTNAATASYDGGAESAPASVTVKFGMFTLKKIDKNHNGIAGAQFSVTGSDGNAIIFEKTDVNGEWVRAADQSVKVDNVTYFKNVPTSQGGALYFWGLAEGGYSVYEQKVAEGYAQQYRAGFSVSIDKNGQRTYNYDKAKDQYKLVTFRDADGAEVTPSNSTKVVGGAAQVLNIKNISELPLTGGAGLTMFVTAAIVFSGVGVTLLVKSGTRRARRVMRA
ncbi:isopeptide-forming domain-containing fimbrial protein [Bifidobacterium olomucense]|uniref:SpaA-like prealbumin fold domain-containing protein n=1 Tax=Bifidobacterium olomucense TaxID=2675324 RepID=A0A7Y0EZ59_9BIFI|nr:isopeptide-forming domain-containing fimbrial protein [Bifidobacterium sp. DSM 109959]NMM99080.1 hypothetical protein [Bifidobacterium sp. DSM 109959]